MWTFFYSKFALPLANLDHSLEQVLLRNKELTSLSDPLWQHLYAWSPNKCQLCTIYKHLQYYTQFISIYNVLTVHFCLHEYMGTQTPSGACWMAYSSILSPTLFVFLTLVFCCHSWSLVYMMEPAREWQTCSQPLVWEASYCLIEALVGP